MDYTLSTGAVKCSVCDLKLLIRPSPLTDESLESYLLRLCQANCYEHVGVLIAAIVNSFPKLNDTFSGVIPTDLHSINVCHANHTSAKRYRALMELVTLTGNDVALIQDLILFRSPQLFSQKHQAVIRQGKLIPRLFLREQAVPVCPDCLIANSYIRQLWHYKTYHVCHIHKKLLVKTCPECHAIIDYQKAFDIALCKCGCDLREAAALPAGKGCLLSCASLLAGEVANVPAVVRDKSTSQRFGVLLWWWLEKLNSKQVTLDNADLTPFFDYFECWPHSLIDDLDQRLEQAKSLAVVAAKDRKFSTVFGNLLGNAAKLPNQNFAVNFILCEIVGWIAAQLRSSSAATIKLLQVHTVEAAILLSTTTTEIYRLMEEGYLKTHCRLKTGEPIELHNTVFRLGDVFELWVSNFQTEHSNQQHFLSKW